MAIQISTYETYKSLPKEDYAGCTTIVIDVMRATTTITTALCNGAKSVVPVEEVEEGIQAKERMIADGEKCINGGERGGVKLPSYDCDNSPLQFTKEKVADTHVVLCTTNGTQAIAAAGQSSAILIGCMNNKTAVAKAAVTQGKDIIILCSGTKGKFTCDDIVTAGAIADCILKELPRAQPDDLTCTSMYLYQSNVHALKDFLTFTLPYKILKELGLEHEFDYCLKEDIACNVPIMRDGHIVNL
ncbi:2-phosphosulfolactate phosphatase [Christensenellaceae bacterium OttesenSCG-928-K19]|nr:2-phosphosulfolactate phosphatase [Christensenellaceae bacterium OttesenSCG-928-K19]